MCVNVRQLKIIAHIIEKVLVTPFFDHPCECVCDSAFVNTVALEFAGLCKETQERVGAYLGTNIVKCFPFSTETNDGTVDSIVLTAVNEFLAPVMVCKKIEKAVTFLSSALEILISIGSDEEFFVTRGRGGGHIIRLLGWRSGCFHFDSTSLEYGSIVDRSVIHGTVVVLLVHIFLC